jgi:hypothetical protein
LQITLLGRSVHSHLLHEAWVRSALGQPGYIVRRKSARARSHRLAVSAAAPMNLIRLEPSCSSGWKPKVSGNTILPESTKMKLNWLARLWWPLYQQEGHLRFSIIALLSQAWPIDTTVPAQWSLVTAAKRKGRGARGIYALVLDGAYVFWNWRNKVQASSIKFHVPSIRRTTEMKRAQTA